MGVPWHSHSAVCSRKEQVPGCRQKDTVQVLILPGRLLIHPGLQAARQVRGLQVHAHRDRDLLIPADRVPVFPEAAAVPAATLPQAGTVILPVQVRPRVQ